MKLNPSMLLVFVGGVALSFPSGVGAAADDQAVQLNARRIGEALQMLGRPLSEDAERALSAGEGQAAVEAVLDPLCLVEIDISPESRVKAA